MDFFGLTMVKNEEDIIEQFVRHNLTYFKKLYVFDHSSSDNTLTILKNLAAEGLPVVAVYNTANAYIGHAQTEVMSSMLRLAVHENGAGVYFPVDADEFLHLNVSTDELKKQLDALGDVTSINVPYLRIVFPDNASENLFFNPPKSFNVLERWSHTVGNHGKAIVKITDPAAVDHLTLGQGNHHVHGRDGWIPINKVCDAMRYIHVPVRSPQQAFRKFVCGWFSNVQRFGKDTVIANHWKKAFDLICDGKGEEGSDLAFMLNNIIYAGEVNLERDFETVDTETIFNYKLAYGHLRKNGLGVILRNIESDFDAMFRKLSQ